MKSHPALKNAAVRTASGARRMAIDVRNAKLRDIPPALEWLYNGLRARLRDIKRVLLWLFEGLRVWLISLDFDRRESKLQTNLRTFTGPRVTARVWQ